MALPLILFPYVPGASQIGTCLELREARERYNAYHRVSSNMLAVCWLHGCQIILILLVVHACLPSLYPVGKTSLFKAGIWGLVSVGQKGRLGRPGRSSRPTEIRSPRHTLLRWFGVLRAHRRQISLPYFVTKTKMNHVCVKCGLVTTRNHASAMEILRLGPSLQAPTRSEVTTCMA